MKIKLTVILAIVFALSLVCTAFAGVWEAEIKVQTTSALNSAKNRLVIGQKNDAIDDAAGGYNVPAMLSGNLQAYIEHNNGEAYWKYIKGVFNSVEAPSKSWVIHISSEDKNVPVKLSWNLTGFPAELNLVLKDAARSRDIDMLNVSEYTYTLTTSERDSGSIFIIEVRK